MSTTFGDFSMFLSMRHPDQPGQRMVFQITKNRRVRVVLVRGSEDNSDTWEWRPESVGDSLQGQELMTPAEAKVRLAELESDGWVDADNDNILGTCPAVAGVSGAQMDAINLLPTVTRQELLND